MGNALANAADKNIFSTIYKASQTFSGGDLAGYWADASEGSVTAADATGQGFVDSLIVALQRFDEADVTGEKTVVVTPATYYSLFGAGSASTMTNSAMNQDVGGNGSVALGNAPTIMGCKVLMSNHLPTGAQTSPANGVNENGSATDYSSNEADLKGLIFTKDAAATVKLLDLGVESEYQIERQGTLMVAKYAMGHNVLRGKSAICIK
jgi:hypothetical protein